MDQHPPPSVFASGLVHLACLSNFFSSLLIVHLSAVVVLLKRWTLEDLLLL